LLIISKENVYTSLKMHYSTAQIHICKCTYRSTHYALCTMHYLLCIRPLCPICCVFCIMHCTYHVF
jgi:hypothetical protein